MIQCTACGSQLFGDAKYCEQCGTKLLTKSYRDAELHSLEKNPRPLQFTLVLAINYVVSGLIVVLAFITMLTPRVIYEQTVQNGQVIETTSNSYTMSLIDGVIFLVLAFLFFRLTIRLKNYSYKARNITVALYAFNLLFGLVGMNLVKMALFINLVSVVVSLFVIVTLLFRKDLQDLWNYNH